jgi:hypothetical protein
VVVDVPSGGTVDIKMQLSGLVARSSQYQLTVVRQPTVNSDDIRFTLKGRDGWRVRNFPGFQVEGGTGTATVSELRTDILTAQLGNG